MRRCDLALCDHDVGSRGLSRFLETRQPVHVVGTGVGNDEVPHPDLREPRIGDGPDRHEAGRLAA